MTCKQCSACPCMCTCIQMGCQTLCAGWLGLLTADPYPALTAPATCPACCRTFLAGLVCRHAAPQPHAAPEAARRLAAAAGGLQCCRGAARPAGPARQQAQHHRQVRRISLWALVANSSTASVAGLEGRSALLPIPQCAHPSPLALPLFAPQVLPVPPLRCVRRADACHQAAVRALHSAAPAGGGSAGGAVGPTGAPVCTLGAPLRALRRWRRAGGSRRCDGLGSFVSVLHAWRCGAAVPGRLPLLSFAMMQPSTYTGLCMNRTAPAAGAIVCDSLDCGVYFERRKVWHELQAVAALAQAGLALLDPADPAQR